MVYIPWYRRLFMWWHKKLGRKLWLLLVLSTVVAIILEQRL